MLQKKLDDYNDLREIALDLRIINLRLNRNLLYKHLINILPSCTQDRKKIIITQYNKDVKAIDEKILELRKLYAQKS